jgi:hypothetical protein
VKKITILIPTHVLPTSKTVVTIFFDNFLSVLKTKFDVKLIWLVYTPNKLKINQNFSNNEEILDIHDFSNAFELIEKIKPDLVYASPDWSFIDYAISSASCHFDIPVFFMVHAKDYSVINKELFQNIKTNFTRFFESSISSTTEKNNKKIALRGRFFLFKYFFLLKTKIQLRESVFSTFFNLWFYILSGNNNSKFAPKTIQFLENEQLISPLINLGFSKSNLIVTGNPMYDSFFKNLKKSNEVNNPKKILFAPSTLYEHGFCSLKERNYAVQQIVKKINENQDKFELLVKIHPSTSSLSEHETIIHKINPNIPIFQKGGIDKYLDNVDIIISSQSSTAEVYALLAHKKIVICNFFSSEDDLFVKEGIAVSCNNPDNLISCLENSFNLNNYEIRRENFIKKFMYKLDGNSSKRILDILITVLEKNINKL